MKTAHGSLATHDALQRIAEPLVDELYRDFNGEVSRPWVQRVVVDLLERCGDAPVTVYLPIIVRRYAEEQLQRERGSAPAGRQARPGNPE